MQVATLKKIPAMFLALAVGLFLFLLIYLIFFQHYFLFFPPAASQNLKPALAEEAFFETTDGVRLNGWLFPVKDDAQITVLYFHGNAEDITGSVAFAEWLQKQGMGLFAIDYRGYGKSGERLAHNEAEFLLDAESAYQFLVQEKQIPAQKILVWGRSLGGAAAVHVAATRPVAGLVTQSAFSSALEIAQKQFPFLPVKQLIRFPLRSDEKIKKVKAPILILHAPDDEVVSFTHGKKLYQLAPSPKQFIEIQGGHNGSLRQLLENKETEIAAFFDSL